MPSLRQAQIPLFYRIFFTWIDPAISIPSIWAHFAAAIPDGPAPMTAMRLATHRCTVDDMFLTRLSEF